MSRKIASVTQIALMFSQAVGLLPLRDDLPERRSATLPWIRRVTLRGHGAGYGTEGTDMRRGASRRDTPLQVRKQPYCEVTECSSEVLRHQLRHVEHADLRLAAEHRLELVVGIDCAAVLCILQVVLLDVLPELLHDFRARHRLVADDGRELRARRERLHKRSVRRTLRGLLCPAFFGAAAFFAGAAFFAAAFFGAAFFAAAFFAPRPSSAQPSSQPSSRTSSQRPCCLLDLVTVRVASCRIDIRESRTRHRRATNYNHSNDAQ